MSHVSCLHFQVFVHIVSGPFWKTAGTAGTTGTPTSGTTNSSLPGASDGAQAPAAPGRSRAAWRWWGLGLRRELGLWRSVEVGRLDAQSF